MYVGKHCAVKFNNSIIDKTIFITNDIQNLTLGMLAAGQQSWFQ